MCTVESLFFDSPAEPRNDGISNNPTSNDEALKMERLFYIHINKTINYWRSVDVTI
jgi:hypothetical protein